MIPGRWIERKGQGAVVGVVETCVDASVAGIKKHCIAIQPSSGTSRHGTHVCSTVLQMASECSLVISCGTVRSADDLCGRLKWIGGYHVDVLNLSFVCAETMEVPPVLAVLDEMLAHGTMVVCAWNGKLKYPWSGNDGYLVAGRDFVCRNENTAHVSDGRTAVMRGTSVQTALVSGLCALGKAVDKTLGKRSFLELVRPSDVPEQVDGQWRMLDI